MRFYLLQNAFGDSLYSVWARDAFHAHDKLLSDKHVPHTEFKHILNYSVLDKVQYHENSNVTHIE